jgi:hypothetical protein
MKDYLLGIKYKCKHWLGRYPMFFFPMYSLVAPIHHKNNLLLRKNVEIVIEGFPRSANTFAVVAFNLAQKREVPMAHHLHVEAQILRGVAFSLPVIALIRHPADAINSLMTRHPGVVGEYSKRYENFYSAVLSVVDGVIVAEFNDVTNNFGAVVSRVNKRYSTNFALFEHTPKNVEAVFEKIDEINHHIDGGKLTHVARPVAGRGDVPSQISRDDPRIAGAVKLYERLTVYANQ